MRQRRLMNQINVVPYIDVMLVLLVIFMVTPSAPPSGSVELPSVAKSSLAKSDPIEVLIRGENDLSLRRAGEERPMAREDLVEAVRAAQAANPEQAVLIAADKNVRYEAVMQVMDGLQRAGVTRLGLAVRRSGP